RTPSRRGRAPGPGLGGAGPARSRSARSAITARLALPSSGAAVTETRSTSPRQPTTAFIRAFGCTRTWSKVSGVGPVILGVGLDVLIEEALVHLEGGAQPLRELPARPPEGEDLAAQVRFRGARGLDEPLRLHLGLAEDHARLAPRLVLHLLHEPLRVDQGLLPHVLAFF